MRENEPATDDATHDVADRRARAARIRRRSLELIETLGADHPLVAEALARADALETDPDSAAGHDPSAGTDRGAAGTIDLRSSADTAR